MNGTVGIGIGDKSIGAGAPVLVQSMTTTDTADVAATIAQITALEAAGCELVRVAVPDAAAAKALREVKERVGVPIIADVHYRPTVALAALEAGADKIRINPGTIKDQKEVEGIVSVAAEKGIPVRIGVNSGSLHPRYRDSGSDLAAALVNSALEYVRIFEDVGFDRIVLSVKSSSVVDTVRAYRILARKTRYPLHIGVTEAGTLISGTVKSAVGLGLLLFDGIGDTIRVSLTAPPVQEVDVAFKILRSLGLREPGPELISCPTCGRSKIDLVPVAEAVEGELARLTTPLKVAVMGCEVNGPGEAREADIGIAWGNERGLLFKKGKVVGKLSAEELVPVLLREMRKSDS